MMMPTITRFSLQTMRCSGYPKRTPVKMILRSQNRKLRSIRRISLKKSKREKMMKWSPNRWTLKLLIHLRKIQLA